MLKLCGPRLSVGLLLGCNLGYLVLIIAFTIWCLVEPTSGPGVVDLPVLIIDGSSLAVAIAFAIIGCKIGKQAKDKLPPNIQHRVKKSLKQVAWVIIVCSLLFFMRLFIFIWSLVLTAEEPGTHGVVGDDCGISSSTVLCQFLALWLPELLPCFLVFMLHWKPEIDIMGSLNALASVKAPPYRILGLDSVHTPLLWGKAEPFGMSPRSVTSHTSYSSLSESPGLLAVVEEEKAPEIESINNKRLVRNKAPDVLQFCLSAEVALWSQPQYSVSGGFLVLRKSEHESNDSEETKTDKERQVVVARSDVFPLHNRELMIGVSAEQGIQSSHPSSPPSSKWLKSVDRQRSLAFLQDKKRPIGRMSSASALPPATDQAAPGKLAFGEPNMVFRLERRILDSQSGSHLNCLPVAGSIVHDCWMELDVYAVDDSMKGEQLRLAKLVRPSRHQVEMHPPQSGGGFEYEDGSTKEKAANGVARRVLLSAHSTVAGAKGYAWIGRGWFSLRSILGSYFGYVDVPITGLHFHREGSYDGSRVPSSSEVIGVIRVRLQAVKRGNAEGSTDDQVVDVFARTGPMPSPKTEEDYDDDYMMEMPSRGETDISRPDSDGLIRGFSSSSPQELISREEASETPAPGRPIEGEKDASSPIRVSRWYLLKNMADRLLLVEEDLRESHYVFEIPAQVWWALF